MATISEDIGSDLRDKTMAIEQELFEFEHDFSDCVDSAQTEESRREFRHLLDMCGDAYQAVYALEKAITKAMYD